MSENLGEKICNRNSYCAEEVKDYVYVRLSSTRAFNLVGEDKTNTQTAS